jgi:transcriptional regulator with XRE-family HTH domain
MKFVILQAIMSTEETVTKLRRWREQYSLTQVDAARLLGVSQPYLSLLEKGARPLRGALRDRLNVVRPDVEKQETIDDRLRAQLSALGYPGFAHVDPARPAAEPAVLVLSALSQPTVDARVTEALPWLAREYADTLDWTWLVEQAKLRNLQNRLGFLIALASASGVSEPAMKEAMDELDKARLLAEATFCWDSMPAPTRKWTRERRSPEAEHWNVVSLMRPESASDASQATK